MARAVQRGHDPAAVVDHRHRDGHHAEREFVLDRYCDAPPAPAGPVGALRRGADIVVATPGRALDHLRRGSMNLDALEVLVLDEADEMLDMGFAEDLEAILETTPASRQTALFAATMAPRIASIAERHLKKPARVHIKAEKVAPGDLPRVRQVAYVVARAHKNAALNRVLEFEAPPSAIVFCRTRIEVDELTDTLKSHGYGAQALHGGLDQRQRDRVMQLFRTGKADVLVATDVAARGLDVPSISHVINFGLPMKAEDYVHHIGRTGRAGRSGVAFTVAEHRGDRHELEAHLAGPDFGVLLGAMEVLGRRSQIEVMGAIEDAADTAALIRRIRSRGRPGEPADASDLSL